MSQITQRACIRLPCEFAANIIFSGGDTEITKKAIISNISTTGVQILSPSFVATGQTLTASFKIPGHRKTNYNLEVMRIESLQGRMPGHFPYALGARFIDFHQKKENQIAQFIEGKVTCRSWRRVVAIILLLLAGAETTRVIYQANENTAALLSLTAQSIMNWISLVLSAGFAGSSLTIFLNQKKFITLSKLFLMAGALLSLSRIVFYAPLLSGDTGSKFFWWYEILTFTAQITLILGLSKMGKFFKAIKHVLTQEKISPGQGNPTFTIL